MKLDLIEGGVETSTALLELPFQSHLFHRRTFHRQNRDGGGGKTFNFGNTRTRRKISDHRGRNRQHQQRRQNDRLGQIRQQRTNLHRPRLHFRPRKQKAGIEAKNSPNQVNEFYGENADKFR